mmetsp:Transcript_7457/g.13584  ORF Transcript_7457/g.13584 Transcript_7457/m.13584 type:complete len:120 (+) Transcript_7457:1338-1697(+)
MVHEMKGRCFVLFFYCAGFPFSNGCLAMLNDIIMELNTCLILLKQIVKAKYVEFQTSYYIERYNFNCNQWLHCAPKLREFGPRISAAMQEMYPVPLPIFKKEVEELGTRSKASMADPYM